MIYDKNTDNCFNFVGNRSLSKVFFNCFCIVFHDSTALAVIEYFPYLLVLWKSFMRLTCVELEVS